MENPYNPTLCYVCGKEQSQWFGYAKDENGKRMNFCENCKVEWIKFANKYGIEFGLHDEDFGVKDGHNACPINVPREVVVEIWKLFIKKKMETTMEQREIEQKVLKGLREYNGYNGKDDTVDAMRLIEFINGILEGNKNNIQKFWFPPVEIEEDKVGGH